MMTMRTIRIIPHQFVDNGYSDDIDRIVTIFSERSYNITRPEAQELWNRHSTDNAAGWLIMPEHDTQIWEALKRHWRGNA